ncbi:MAG TPA: hypothetical protein VGT61_01085 [Thermomicrobiales bacterium]|jgi:hypothetical protein|nr:hypothetical protein [Thermomicrobiales bacterium]
MGRMLRIAASAVLLLTMVLGVVWGGAQSAHAGTDPDGTSRETAIAPGTTGEVSDYEVTVLDVTPFADDLIAAENQFNDPAGDGFQFYLVRVEVTYTGNESGNPGFDLSFQAVGAGNTGYTTFEDSCGVTPDDEYTAGELFEGGTVEYNVCWRVAEDDVESLVMYVEELFSFDAEPVWFSLGNDPVVTDPGDAGDATPAGDAGGGDDELSDAGAGRDNPVPVGEVAAIGDYQLSVVSVTPLADDLIAAENQFNDSPGAGNQFFIARVAVTYTGTETGNPGFDLNVQAVGDRNVGYTTFEDSCGVTPDDEYSAGELFPGGTVEYNVCWRINSDDAGSLMLYVEELFSFDGERVWFSLEG